MYGWIMSGKSKTGWSFTHNVEEIPKQGRSKGCHRMCAPEHLISGLESLYEMNE